VVYVAGENLPRRPIVQFDEVAFGMFHDFHAMAPCKHNQEKTVMLAESSNPRAALKCRSTFIETAFTHHRSIFGSFAPNLTVDIRIGRFRGTK
jgi:hypothetical protein